MRLFALLFVAVASLLAPCWTRGSGPTGARLIPGANEDSAASHAVGLGTHPHSKDEKPRQNSQLTSEQPLQGLALATKLEADGTIAMDRGELANAAKCHRGAISIRQKLAPASLDLAESLNHLGDVEEQLGELTQAEVNERRALAIRQRLSPDSLAVAETLHSLGRVEMDRGDLADAENNMQRSLSIRRKLAPGSHDLGFSLIGLASLYGRRGDLRKQEESFQEASSLEEKLTPVNRASIFQGLGNICLQRGQLEMAEEYFRKALAIRQEVMPSSLQMAISLSNMGNLASNRGDLDLAKQYYQQAFEMRERVAPGSLAVATSLSELGSIAQIHGNLAQAEKYFRDALKIEQQLSPGGLSVAGSLHQLGIVFWLREELTKSESYIARGAKIRHRLSPESPGEAQSLTWLGILSNRRGDVEQAEAYFKQALEISKKSSSESLMTSQILGNLGDNAERRNQLAEAQDYFLRALAIQTKIVPESPSEAFTLQKLGDLARKRHDVTGSEKYLRETLSIREKKVPGSLAHANLLLDMASLLRQEHKIDASAQLYEQAFHILDHQMTNLGGDEAARSVFRARYERDYKDYIDLLISDEKKPGMAFEVFERSRARTLLELLESARINVHNGCDPELLKRERALRETISAKSSNRLELLNGPHSERSVAVLDKQISELTEQYSEIQEQIQAASPDYASLSQPATLSVNKVQEELLDPDTVLLEYSLAERRSYVWGVTSTSMVGYPLPGRKVIENAARNAYELLTARSRRVADETIRQRQMRLAQADLDYSKAASELSQMILGPIANLLDKKRLLIVSDGALQYIPFGALSAPRPSASKLSRDEPESTPIADGIDEPLAMEHEIVNLPSASILAELRRARINRREPPKEVAVFADPVFDRRDDRVVQVLFRTASERRQTAATRSPSMDSSLGYERLTRSATDVGLIQKGGDYLGRLLWTQREAAAILRVIPAGQGMEAIGFEANRASAINPALSQYRIVHFATHALLDSKNPELSGLVFSLVNKRGQPQNGFLDLEQIYNLNLPVDLIVLSACDTALGPEVRGEGLIGLARGFMYAGASRVMASLWSVDDEVTSELMARFYKSLEQDKMSPAAALRAAQIAVSRDKRWSAPYYWAGFQLQGEWQ